ncbi:hypothetical protein [Spirosoma pollinicola]|uniref:Outer membrane protein beta-barrel domain-containing protein n=1 Tax=Spirosoma pollinicola TaxID=2057025 RepID=A0A2K8Z5H2_9BACT|nr:hypothetical protein [Spirosoma pollinicola]AUD05098.1 hypothetical protein CWM47_26585 [Spirosoma pollinicola]
MSELTDDQLDGLFRKSAEEFDPPFDPAAWQDMKIRLDTHDSPASGGTPLWKNLLRWGVPVCLLLLLTIGGMYIYRADFTHVDSAPVQTPAPAQKDAGISSEMPMTVMQERKPGIAQQGKNDSAQTTPTGLAAQSIDDKNQPAVLPGLVAENAGRDTRTEATKPSAGFVSELGKKTAPNATTESKIAYRLKTARAKVNPIDAAPVRTATLAGKGSTGASMDKQGTETGIQERFSVKKQSKANRIRRTRPFIASNNAVFTPSLFREKSVRNASKRNKADIPNTTEITIQPSNDEAEAAGLPDVNELAIRPARWSKALPFTGRPVQAVPEPELVELPIVVPKPPGERGFSVRLAVAPDLSSVGLKNFARPGTNVGVMLEYRLASRWSIQAGVIQSTKIYRIDGSSEYTAPVGTWAGKGKPLSVDGQCNMIDIPINVRFDAIIKQRQNGLSPSRWFLTTGVTSYYMEQEDYVFNYPSYLHPASYQTGGYGFSHFNISTGYERAISKRLSWQVEPFLKMPLKGVGYFKVDLLSTGAFFSIRYKL